MRAEEAFPLFRGLLFHQTVSLIKPTRGVRFGKTQPGDAGIRRVWLRV